MKPTKWLTVQSESSPSLNTLPNCITLCDLKSDNYWKLIAAEIPRDTDSRPRLKVYKGIGMISEQGLPGMPSAIESFYIEEPPPKSPIIAVAISESVYFYRNMKPYFKYTIPELTVESLEIEIWRKMPVERPENQNDLIDQLKTIESCKLTWLSLELCRIPKDGRDTFIRKHADYPLKRFSTIVAMKCLQKASSDYHPASCLVIVTSNSDVFIIDTQSFVIIHQARVCYYQTSPSQMAVQGQFETDFRIVISSRHGNIYILHKSWLEGKEICKLNNPPIGLTLLPVDQTLIVTGMDKQLTCYSKKGKRLYSTDLPDTPICMTPVHLPHFGITLVAVGLGNKRVVFFNNKIQVDEMELTEVPTAIIFGRLGQEDHVLTIFTETGNINIKILKRTANFEGSATDNKFAMLEKGKVGVGGSNEFLEIPKKTTIFVEQTMREKEHAQAIYNRFQVELWRLRLMAARETVEKIRLSDSSISDGATHAPLKLDAEVGGMGPQFRLFLSITNMCTEREISFLRILLHADQRHYLVNKYIVNLPVLFPGITMKLDFDITAVLDPIDKLPPPDLTAENAIIRVLVFKENHAKPIIAASISMPESESPLEN